MPASRMNALLRIHNFGTEEDPELDYYSLEARDAWEWWQKSRESLVVAMPESCDCCFSEEEKATYDTAVEDCAESIRAIGIRIKGEGNGASS